MPENQNIATVKGSDYALIARKLMLAILIIHLFSLFLPYKSKERDGGSPIYLEKHHVVGIYGHSPEETGFQHRPMAIYVIIGLLVLFGSDLYTEPLWRRYVYWISFILLFWFAMSRVPFRSLGGKISFICVFLVLIAGYINEKGFKRKKVSSVPMS